MEQTETDTAIGEKSRWWRELDPRRLGAGRYIAVFVGSTVISFVLAGIVAPFIEHVVVNKTAGAHPFLGPGLNILVRNIVWLTVMILTYAAFRSLNVAKVIPWIWGGGALHMVLTMAATVLVIRYGLHQADVDLFNPPSDPVLRRLHGDALQILLFMASIALLAYVTSVMLFRDYFKFRERH